ncbi:MAG: ribosome silencing factor [Bacteroidetes bacterium]|nr:ribosome silencing factor [Bacteroidota bacterium]
MAQTKPLQRQIAELTLSRKAKDVVIMDLKKVTTMADYFVVCTGESETQVRAIADAVMEGMTKAGEKPWHSEGLQNLQWVLLDYVDVVVHVFHKDARAFYGLEKLWGDAKIQKIADRKPGGTRKEQSAERPKRKSKDGSSSEGKVV